METNFFGPLIVTRAVLPVMRAQRSGHVVSVSGLGGLIGQSAMSGQQGGDPAKLARALVRIAALEQPPVRWVAGADAVEAVEQKAHTLLAQVDAHRDLSSDLAHDEPAAG